MRSAHSVVAFAEACKCFLQTSMRLEEDMAKLKDSYDGEKLALVDALQSLKNLVIQANPNLAVSI